MEIARSMMKNKCLPNTFWVEAVYIVVYILNMCPTKTVQDNTPIETWCGKKPSTKYLRVFLSIYYIHVPKQKQKQHKLYDKTTKGIFLGYSTQSKGYKIYNLQTKKLDVSRDVEIDENASWNWDEGKVERRNISSQ
jgi:hypothetical protein